MEDPKTVKPIFEDTYGVLELTAKSEEAKYSDEAATVDDPSQSSGWLFKIIEKVKGIFLFRRKNM